MPAATGFGSVTSTYLFPGAESGASGGRPPRSPGTRRAPGERGHPDHWQGVDADLGRPAARSALRDGVLWKPPPHLEAVVARERETSRAA